MTEDLEAVYDLEISPLMAQIIEICKRVNMPMVASFQYAPEELCTSAILPKDCAAVLRSALGCIDGGATPPPLRLRTFDEEGRVTTDAVILP